MPTDPYTLTAADIMALRLRMRSIGFISDGTSGRIGTPFMTYSVPTKEYCLHSQGATVATGADADIMSTLLRNERLEPGYCRRILDTAWNAEDATLSPEALHALTVTRNATAARAKLYAEEQSAEQLRRASHFRKPTKEELANISLDDLDL